MRATFVFMTPFSTFFRMKKKCSSDEMLTLASSCVPEGGLEDKTETLLRNKSSLGVCSIIGSAERVNFSCITYPREAGGNVANMWNVCDNA